MTDRVYTTQLTVPAGTLQSAPVSQQVVLDDIQLDSVQVIIPDGHASLTGCAVVAGGNPVVPFTIGTFISGNGEAPEFSYGAQVGANQLTVIAFNTDVYPHTFYFRWRMSDQKAAPVVIESPQASTVPAAADVLDIANLAGVTA